MILKGYETRENYPPPARLARRGDARPDLNLLPGIALPYRPHPTLTRSRPGATLPPHAALTRSRPEEAACPVPDSLPPVTLANR